MASLSVLPDVDTLGPGHLPSGLEVAQTLSPSKEQRGSRAMSREGKGHQHTSLPYIHTCTYMPKHAVATHSTGG